MGLCLFSLPSVYIGLDIGTVYVMVNCQVKNMIERFSSLFTRKNALPLLKLKKFAKPL
jgi:hypothetical protein